MRISDWSSDVCSSDLDAEIRFADNMSAQPRAVRRDFQAIAIVRGSHGSAQRPFDVACQRSGLVGRRIPLDHPPVAADEELAEVPLDRIDAEQAALLLLQPLPQRMRSEEHTSELQSLMRNSYAVFCLKNKKPT